MRKLFYAIALLIFTLSSCENVLTDLNPDGTPKTANGYQIMQVSSFEAAKVYLPSEVPGQFNETTLEVCLNTPYKLTAGQYKNAGSLEVVNDGTNLYVTYNTTGTLGVLHLWVGTDLSLVPSTPDKVDRKTGVVLEKGNPIPGKFPFTYDATGLQHYTFVVPLSTYNYVCGTELYFLAHSEVTLNGVKETAFGGNTGINIETSGRWYFYDTYTVQCCTFVVDEPEHEFETAFAKGGYIFDDQYTEKNGKITYNSPDELPGLGLGVSRWGWAINIQSEGTFTYDIWAAAGNNNTANGVKVGTASIEYSGSVAKVTYSLSGSVLAEVHIYANDLVPATNAPGQYGFVKEFSTPFTQTTFTESFNVSDTNGDGVWFILHATVGFE